MQRALEATQVNKDRRRIKTPLTVKIQQANKKIDSDCSAKILKKMVQIEKSRKNPMEPEADTAAVELGDNNNSFSETLTTPAGSQKHYWEG